MQFSGLVAVVRGPPHSVGKLAIGETPSCHSYRLNQPRSLERACFGRAAAALGARTFHFRSSPPAPSCDL